MRGEQIRNDKKQHDTNRGCSGSSGNTLVSKCVKEIMNEDVFSRPEREPRLRRARGEQVSCAQVCLVLLIMLQEGENQKKVP